MILYSVSPPREILRVSDTSSYGKEMRPKVLSKISVTSAAPAGSRESEPEKIKSDIEPARKVPGLPSPSANNTASVMLLFPEPLGPTITVIPSESGIRTGRANVLKPFMYIAVSTDNLFYAVLPLGVQRKAQQKTVIRKLIVELK